MAKGTTKYWTEEQEESYERLLRGSDTPAMRHLIMIVRDTLKYDLRTRQGKRAAAQARLRLATATDEELEELAELGVQVAGEEPSETVSQAFERLKMMRQQIRVKGIRKEALAR